MVGRTYATCLCNYAPFTEAGRTPSPSVATWAPLMPTPPRKRLRDLPSWSGPMAIAGILPLTLVNAVRTAEQEWAKRKRRVRIYIRYEPRVKREGNGWESSDHSRIWSQPGKAVPGSHLPTGHIGQLNRAQSKASAGPMYSKFRTPSPAEHSHVVPKHQLRRYPPPQKKKKFFLIK